MRSHYADFKVIAMKLRRQGLTYSEIQKRLHVKIPKSTLSFWVSDLDLPASYNKKIRILNEHSRKKAIKAKRKIFEKQLANLITINDQLTNFALQNKDVQKIILAILYFGEGSKWISHRGLSLGSSDSLIIRLYCKLLRNVYNIDTDVLRARISYRADQDIAELTRFWSKMTGIPKNHFYKTKCDPRTIGKMTKNLEYKGVCVISCAGTRKQLELEIIAKRIAQKMGR